MCTVHGNTVQMCMVQVCTCVTPQVWPPLLYRRPHLDPGRVSDLPHPQPSRAVGSRFPKSMFLTVSLPKPSTAPPFAKEKTLRTGWRPPSSSR